MTLYTLSIYLSEQLIPTFFEGQPVLILRLIKKELEQNLRNLTIESPLWISQQHGLFIKLKGSFTSETSEVLNHNFKIIVTFKNPEF